MVVIWLPAPSPAAAIIIFLLAGLMAHGETKSIWSDLYSDLAEVTHMRNAHGRLANPDPCNDDWFLIDYWCAILN
jgi:hypothetical protein